MNTLSPESLNGKADDAINWEIDELYEELELMRVDSLVEMGSGRREQIVEGLIASRQPGVLGGPFKGLKTTLAILVALCVATGKPFLDLFAVPKPRNVWFLSSESGADTILDTAERQAKSLGLDLHDDCTRLHIGTRLPRLDDDEHLARLTRALLYQRIEMAIFDPTYLLIGAVKAGVNPASIFSMGSWLAKLSVACLLGRCTPIFVHHANEGVKPGRPMTLGDLSHAGLAEFSRQWILLNRRTEYDPDQPGKHELFMSWGGSAGHCGILGLDIDEGQAGPDLRGRTWATVTRPVAECRDIGKRAKGKADGANLLAILDELAEQSTDGVVGFEELKTQLGFNTARMNRTVQGLEKQGAIARCEARKVTGAASRQVKGLRRCGCI
jgi:hypothetical protein